MPYIDKAERAKVDEAIDALILRVKPPMMNPSPDNILATAGVLNYAITRLVLGVFACTPKRYHWIALACGVLDNVSREFYRRFAAPYEDNKKHENGDVGMW